MEAQLVMPDMLYFAELDENDNVVNIIASGDVYESVEAERAMLVKISGHNRWIQTWQDGSSRGRYACIGGHYDAENDVFIDAKPIGNPSWVLSDGEWIPPVAMPFTTSIDSWPESWGEFVETSHFIWDEEVVSWVPAIVMVRRFNGVVE